MAGHLNSEQLNHEQLNKEQLDSEQYDYDLFVIGAGSGGVRAARMAASKGKKDLL